MAADPPSARAEHFVPGGFTPPRPPRTESFWLEPLGPEHNDADYAAWTSSMEHLAATPGLVDWGWPHEMTLEENLGDLQMHADHFARGVGFTYTVRSTVDDDVIGCVYIYPSDDPSKDACVRSWVRSSHADLDAELWATVSDWLATKWPFGPDAIGYAAREGP